MKKKRPIAGVNVGTSSLLLIFVTLCLVSFAVLTMASASADLRLTGRLADRTLTYYNACSEAERFIADLDTRLKQAYSEASDEYEFHELAGGYEDEFTSVISDKQTLCVNVDICYPSEPGGRLFTIRTWRIMTDDEMELSNSLTYFEDF